MSWLIGLTLAIAFYLWGWFNYWAGLRRGEAMGTYRTLLHFMLPEEMERIVRELGRDEAEVMELKKLYKAK